MITQLIAHGFGDYLLQSNWMASEKAKNSLAAGIHAMFYTLPFLFLTQSWKALAIISGTHFIIDRFRLARYLCWLKNFLAPRRTEVVSETECPSYQYWWHPWSECSATGYKFQETPVFLSLWLMIIADNTLHLLCNYLALNYFA